MKYDSIKISYSEMPQEDKDFWKQFRSKSTTQSILDSRQRRILWGRRNRQKVKEEVLTHYGDGVLACVRCGFSDIRALSIDHIDGSGHKERMERRNDSTKTYYSLRRLGFPNGFQTLCMNCQYIKREENKEYRWY